MTQTLPQVVASCMAEDVEDPDLRRPTNAAHDACVRLSERLAPLIDGQPKMKRAAFNTEEGGVELVLQSLVTNLFLKFVIGPDGQLLNVHTIDDSTPMRSAHPVATLDGPDVLRLVEWLTGKADGP